MNRIENYFKHKQAPNLSNNINQKILEPYIGPRPFNRDPKIKKGFLAEIMKLRKLYL